MQEHGEGLGYARAAAAAPVPTTIHTPAAGLSTGRVIIDAPDGPLPVYFAQPEGATGAPVVIVICEAFGLHEHIADVARRFAHRGYLAVAPDLMARRGDPRSFADVGALVRDLLLHIPDPQVIADLDAAVAWARAHGGDAERLFATGFCWGGRWTWLYAAHRPMNAAVAWYGIVDGSSLFPEDARLFPRHPLDVAGALRTPVLGLYGARDEAIAPQTVAAMRAELAAGGRCAQMSEIVTYPETGHAFFADYRDSYRADQARDGWRRCLDWFGSHGTVRETA